MNGRLVGQGLVTALLLSLSATGVAVAGMHPRAGWGTDDWSSRRDLDLTAAALTGPADSHPSDTAYQAVRVDGFRGYKADATGEASADCDGCTADAVTVQIVDVRGPRHGTVDNVANASASCTGCGATALSVQVVVLRRGGSVEANNRALSVNAGCDHCGTASAAFQLVVSGDRARMSATDRRALMSWARQEARTLRQQAYGTSVPPGLNRSPGPAAPHLSRTPARPGAQALDGLDRLVTGLLGTRTVLRHAHLSAS